MNAHITKNNNISAGTVARTAVLGLALANQILSACGKPLLPIDSAQLEQWVTAGLTSAAAIWAWWENNSFTKEALAADSYLEQLKKSNSPGNHLVPGAVFVCKRPIPTYCDTLGRN